ncbi:MAG: tRNA (guanine(46)-N(7))-methyltransferase TrmB [Proteobacteria bacterium]|nr:tRNA (guanine(46)-N(7))-methyltransferase TrmB [Pseudomonadota bacterium]
MTTDVSPRKRILFGRRRGKPLRKGQQVLIDEALPKLTVPISNGEIDLSALFKKEMADYWLEIGFGSGEHLSWQAEHNPEIGFIGCEPFLNGVATLLGKLTKSGVDNVRIHNDAAEILLDKLPAGSISRGFLLFPDPWPKTSHHKRRFVSSLNIERLAHVLKDGAELRIGTDHTGYGEWILWHFLNSEQFDWQAETAEDWRVRPADWPPTRYEQKALAKGLRPVYYRFRRRPR